MEDEAPIIYGLEFQARALAPQAADTEVARFFVGTQSLKFDNQIHQLEYDEENNTLVKAVFQHAAGEIWHISTSPTDPSLLTTCYNQITSDDKCELRGAIWKLPTNRKLSDGCDDTLTSLLPLELVAELEPGAEFKNIIWEPLHGTKLVSLTDSSVYFWDIESGVKPVMTMSVTPEQKGRLRFNSVSWNPHHYCNLVATAIDTTVRSWDLRTEKQSWVIENAHGQLVRDLNFNPNKQYYLATCGDDCLTKFWDVRNPQTPLMMFSDHSHWVWSVRYNNFHDQLVLTSSSDSRVILSRAASISSEPSGKLVDDDDCVIADEKETKHSKSNNSDGVISVYEEHEDSVYASEWSTADPWLFASLSYDGRLIINKVPQAEKYRILL